jgi:hypothetical protein
MKKVFMKKINGELLFSIKIGGFEMEILSKKNFIKTYGLISYIRVRFLDYDEL